MRVLREWAASSTAFPARRAASTAPESISPTRWICSAGWHRRPTLPCSMRRRARPCCRARDFSCRPRWRRPTSSCARSTRREPWCAAPWARTATRCRSRSAASARAMSPSSMSRARAPRSPPLCDGGRREAGIQNAGGEFDVALARYREQVLVAFRDVEDQLSSLRLLAEQSEAQDRAVASASRSTALSGVRYRNGYVSQLDLLDAQRSELRNRRQALQVRSAQYQSTVALVRALGGGWN